MSGPPAELAFLIPEVLAARVAGEHERCTKALERTFDLGARAFFAACLGWAEVVVQLMGLRDPDPAVFAYPEIDRTDGAEQSLDDPNYRHALWMGRFLSAAANRDMDTAVALFRAIGAEGSELGRNAVALVDLAAQLVRDRIDNPSEGTGA